MADDLVVVSNRGPVSYRVGDDGELVPRRGAGGLISTLGPALAARAKAGGITTDTWVAAAISEGDRRAAAEDPAENEGVRIRLLAVDEDAYRGFYDVVSNQTLWFAYHGLDHRPLTPSLGRAWHQAFEAYVEVNRAFAEAVAEEAPEGATVLVQDLHLSLVGGHLARERPDLATAHFAHTPFCWPDGLAVLPVERRRQLLEGLAGHGAVGFHSSRWERAFLACCAEAEVAPPATFVSPAAVEPADLGTVAEGEDCVRRLAEMEELVGDRQLLVRVDRMELSKNVVRGFSAFALLLEEHPELVGRVLFVACCYPSRESLPEYAAYRDAVFAEVERVNERFGPVVDLVAEDDFPRSVAALCRADVALINPVRDGLNMVAKELALVNRRDAVLCLSPEAGAWEELGGAGALAAPPFDLAGTADALHEALTMGADERAERAKRLREAASARTPTDWLGDQLRQARTPAS
ncbi:MAG TPA: trehalose-6-phosphate synthase [Acidimicrobiales bacterium]|nr:trehalose-6-phosphate synthase [Acidimicrobiales bacterium]